MEKSKGPQQFEGFRDGGLKNPKRWGNPDKKAAASPHDETTPQQTTALEVWQEGGKSLVAATAQQQLFLTLAEGRTGFRDGNITYGVGLMVKEHPEAVGYVIAAANTHPELFESRGTEISIRPSLADVRATFPTVINRFSDERMEEILSRFPHVQERVLEARELLSQLPQSASIATIEIVLGTLLQDGRPNNTQSPDEDRRNVIASHELYRELSGSIFKQNASVPYAEQKSILSLAQGLLLKKRMYDAALEQYEIPDEGLGNNPRSAEAVIHVLRQMIASTSDADVKARLQQHLASVKGRFFVEDPREYEIMRHEEGLPDEGSRRHWIEFVGQPHPDQREWTSASRGE